MYSFDGDTGPYLQYAHVRLCSVERKSAPEIVLPPIEQLEDIKTELLVENHAHNMIFIMAQYPDVVKIALKEQQACTLVNYLFKLAHGEFFFVQNE
jgi:arginyl-tRNA synthetase